MHDVQTQPHPFTVPEGRYYLLGDNPAEANECQMLGAYPEAEMRGRVFGNR